MEKNENSSDSLIHLTMPNNPIKKKVQSDIIILDYIQPKYERETKSDLIVKYLTFLVIGIDILIFFGTIQQTIYNFTDLFYIFYFVCFIVFFLLDIAWLHYKLQHIIFGSYKLFMDMSVFKTNSKYY